MGNLIAARGVCREFVSGAGFLGRRRAVALREFSLEIDADRPSFVALAGESGSGKTTAARLLLGLIPPTSGSIRYRDIELAALDAAGYRSFRKDVQAVFQDPFETFNPFYRVGHSLAMAARGFGLASGRRAVLELSGRALGAVGLDPAEVLSRYPHELSGGQRQRVMVARALLVGPRLIIADEPVSMIDASMRASILGSLAKLHREMGISFVYITHDLTTAYQMCDSIIVLYRGVAVEAGPAAAVIADPKHPYTRELIASIPDPQPGMAWLEEPVAAVAEAESGETAGCPYASRCLSVMERCRRGMPGSFAAGEGRIAVCWLHESGGRAGGGAAPAVRTGGQGGLE